jgi:uncharacterized protein YecE (DUF72 family)
MTQALVGSSGWSYPTWRPGFYPPGLQPEAFLGFYAERFDAVELNATKYRLPSEEQFSRWADAVPESFRFAVKAPPRLMRRIDVFEERVRALGNHLGCVRVVVETPRDDGWLELFLGSHDPAIPYALDLRDTSWSGIENDLASARVAQVDAPETSLGWCYLRFREPPYDDSQLDEIGARIRPLLAASTTVYAFFRHEDEPTAPAYATALLGRIAQTSRGQGYGPAQPSTV